MVLPHGVVTISQRTVSYILWSDTLAHTGCRSDRQLEVASKTLRQMMEPTRSIVSWCKGTWMVAERNWIPPSHVAASPVGEGELLGKTRLI